MSKKDLFVFVKAKCPREMRKHRIVKELLELRLKYEPDMELVIEFE